MSKVESNAKTANDPLSSNPPSHYNHENVDPSVLVDCSVTLKPQYVPGGTVWIRQGPGNEATILIIVENLPDPRTFGEEFTDYWYIIYGVIERRMGRLEGTSIWFASHSGTDLPVPFPPLAPVSIVPGTKGEPAAGFAVLDGNLRDCH